MRVRWIYHRLKDEGLLPILDAMPMEGTFYFHKLGACKTGSAQIFHSLGLIERVGLTRRPVGKDTTKVSLWQGTLALKMVKRYHLKK